LSTLIEFSLPAVIQISPPGWGSVLSAVRSSPALSFSFRRQPVQAGLGLKGPNGQYDLLVAHLESTLPKLMGQESRRVTHLRRGQLEPVGELVEDGRKLDVSGIGRPLRLLQAAANGVPVNVQIAGMAETAAPA